MADQTVKVEIKWGSKVYKGVEINFADHPDVFRAALYSLTRVPPANQKLMGLKGNLGDSWSPFIGKIKNGQKIMMTGTAEQVSAPTEKTLFLEDLPPEQQTVALYPPGLRNMGNTCYMNATLQYLHVIPELGEAIKKFRPTHSDSQSGILATAGDIWTNLDESRQTVETLMFLTIFRSVHERFAEQVKPGIYAQQDAEEFLQVFFQSLSELPKLTGGGKENLVGENVVEQLFGGEMEEEYKSHDGGELDQIVKVNSFKKLECHIDETIKHISESLKLVSSSHFFLYLSVLYFSVSLLLKVFFFPRVFVKTRLN
eukprot:TRINITY_DN7523_c0_g1_i5.p1 TRINITY_DN7523_c0_g1~~TRINITY_DN7523_c0_g1_i5.p1  ORF type:complete len:313 (+),score=60.81 TRINITY_DN7523_c0_g1_i5:92-1030(+)